MAPTPDWKRPVSKIAWICPDCRDGHSKTWPTVQKNKTKPTFLISIILRIIKEKKH